MLGRKMLDTLLSWKAGHGQECLLVNGACQVGKSYIGDRFVEPSTKPLTSLSSRDTMPGKKVAAKGVSMGIPVNIEELVNGRVVESTRVEFKAGYNPNPVIHSICAFANDIDNIGGGYIVIGVEEKDGVPVLPPKGVPQGEVDGILKQMVGHCHRIEPLYNPVVEPVECMGALVIVVWVPGGHGRPYKASKDVFSPQSQKHYYIRKFASTVVASPQEEKDLFYVSTDIPFDDRPNLLASPDDLDLGLMREHLKEIGSALYGQSGSSGLRDLAADLRLLSGPSEDMHPVNVGILMFSERPERYFPHARIEVVDIPDPTGKGMVEKVFTGPIQRQLRDALGYIRNYAIRESVEKVPGQAQARRAFNYPYEAVEEILSNAVYHRSYQVAEPITVRITPDEMEVTSFPGFDRSISEDAIAGRRIRARGYRNRRIGDFLKELGMTEGRNTGFPTAFAAMEANGSGQIEFEMDDQRGFLSVHIPVHPAFRRDDRAAERARAYEQRVLTALDPQGMTLTELAHAMGYKGISKKLSAAVGGLCRKGLVSKRVAATGTKTLLLPSGSERVAD